MVSEYLNLKRSINAVNNELLTAFRKKTEQCEKEQEENGRLKKKVKLLETKMKDLEAKVKTGEKSQENLNAVLGVIKPVLEQYKWNMEDAKTPVAFSNAIAWEVEMQAEKSEELENKLNKRKKAYLKLKADWEAYNASMDVEEV
jgi:predicted RNase H-like nuclease (RuvC/YqgF family)